MSRFGIDLGGIVADHFAADSAPATLVVITYGALKAGNTSGREKTETSYPCRAFREEFDSSRVGQGTVRAEDCQIRVYVKTLPAGVVPTAKDRLVLNGVSYSILKVRGNAATYVLHARGPGSA